MLFQQREVYRPRFSTDLRLRFLLCSLCLRHSCKEYLQTWLHIVQVWCGVWYVSVSNVMIECDMCCDTRHQVMSQLITSHLPLTSQILQLRCWSGGDPWLEMQLISHANKGASSYLRYNWVEAMIILEDISLVIQREVQNFTTWPFA